MKSSLKVALCQSRSLIGDRGFDPRRQNLENALLRIDEAAKRGAGLLVFGEGYLTGYATGAYLPSYAISLDSKSEFLSELLSVAHEKKIYVIMGMTTRQRGRLYNSAVFVGPRGLIGTYNKTHLFVGPCMSAVLDERSWWKPGVEIPVYRTQIGRVGIQVCYDIAFPEVSRILTLKGADLIVNVAAEFEGYQGFWDTIPRARSLENQTWHVLSSVVGVQGKLTMFGGSRVVDPYGKELARAQDHEEDTILADIDYEASRRARKESDIVGTRVPNLYAPLVARAP